jgi:hypothetical protein
MTLSATHEYGPLTIGTTVNNALEEKMEGSHRFKSLVFVGPDNNDEAYNSELSVSGQSSKEKPPEYKSGASSHPT